MKWEQKGYSSAKLVDNLGRILGDVDYRTGFNEWDASLRFPFRAIGTYTNQEYAQQAVERAAKDGVAMRSGFMFGWKAAAVWANRGDLIADIGSPAYEKDCDAACGVALPVEPFDTYQASVEMDEEIRRKAAAGVPVLGEAQLLADAKRLRGLLLTTQTYVCSNRTLSGASDLCGEIAEALFATRHLRDTDGVKGVDRG